MSVWGGLDIGAQTPRRATRTHADTKHTHTNTHTHRHKHTHADTHTNTHTQTQTHALQAHTDARRHTRRHKHTHTDTPTQTHTQPIFERVFESYRERRQVREIERSFTRQIERETLINECVYSLYTHTNKDITSHANKQQICFDTQRIKFVM